MKSLIRFAAAVVLVALSVLPPLTHAAESLRAATATNVVAELKFTATGRYADPFNEVTLDVAFTDPTDKTLVVPAFWAGGTTWNVRYASPVAGRHTFRTKCSRVDDAGLNGVVGEVVVTQYTGNNPLYARGPIRVAADKRRFEHADGTPFFWLGDTWWMGLCSRLRWPEDVKTLAADRRAKGFNVIQIVAGLYPDMHAFDPRGANEAGFPWTEKYRAIRPEYFDKADERLKYLVEEGFTPCIVGAWGYFMPWVGPEKMKQHWRYLIARYGAMPVVWCAAGEANLPWYLAKGFPYDDREQVKSWTEVMRFIRATDPFHRPLTIHPTGIGRLSARHATDDVSLLDFDMLQTPHGQADAVAPTLATVRESYADTPVMPVINGEAAYEMLMDSIPSKWTRRMFWLSVMSGAPGHTYGSNGIWQVNRKGQPHGPSPHHPPDGAGYGRMAWDEAMNLPGSSQVGFGKKLFERYAWQTFMPQTDWANFAGQTSPSVPFDDAKWIWFPEGEPAKDAPAAKRYLRKEFEISAGKKPTRAWLAVSADDVVTVSVNGKQIGTSSDWRQPAKYDVTTLLREGTNSIAAVVENTKPDITPNPAGFLCVLDGKADGEGLRMTSDATWRASKDEGGDAVTASVLGPYGMSPWGKFADSRAHEGPLAIGAAEGARVVYVPRAEPVDVRKLKRGRTYAASYFDPVSGETTKIGKITCDADGSWKCPPPAIVREDDWVVVLE
jgi:hypothetical protein